MSMGRHRTIKSKSDPTYDPDWSGVSRAPHSDFYCKKCGEQLHDEDGNLYCPVCDDYVGEVETYKQRSDW